MNRLGQDVSVDLKIGFLHAYPNGEVQFEKILAEGDEKKNISRVPKEKVTEQGMDELAKIMI